MTVGELLEILNNEDPNYLILTDAYERGYNTPLKMEIFPIKENKSNFFGGEYEKATTDDYETIGINLTI